MEPFLTRTTLSASQAQALSSIAELEKRMPFGFTADPKKLTELFRKIFILSSTEDGSARFDFGAEPQSKDLSVLVLKEMEKIQKIASEINKEVLSLEGQVRVDEFSRQVDQFKSCLENKNLESNTDLVPSAPLEPRSVVDLKKEIPKPFRSFGESLTKDGLISLAAGGFCLIATLPFAFIAIALGLVFPPLGLSVGAAYLGLAAITTLGLFAQRTITHLVRQKANEKAFAEAETPEALVPLFWKLAPEAQARLFVGLGSEFRSKLCAGSAGFYSRRPHRSSSLQEMADMVDILQGSKETSTKEREQTEKIFLESTKVLMDSKFSMDWKIKDFEVALREVVLDGGLIPPPPYIPPPPSGTPPPPYEGSGR